VPVGVAGKSAGILQAVGPDERPPDDHEFERLQLIARKAGERLAMIRVLAQSEVQAQTDPLTGLDNRRRLEAAVRELVQDGRRYIVAYGDLDHFKLLNDVHGHDAGDRALRLFAAVLRDCVRPDDVVGRYGGEEFVVVLPDCSRSDAIAVLERVRAQLATAIRSAGAPEFTVSFGVASSFFGQSFGETLTIADAALLRAKAEGRDRIVIGGAEPREDVPASRSSAFSSA
jgi:diguanylate cyclase (GGDEF)-like protein